MNVGGRRIVLGVSGGIASYKACTVARRLTEAGAEVDVVLSAAATEFVRPLTFEALTGRGVLTSLWERGRALSHVYLPERSDAIVIAPATANLIARLAQGLADDLLSTLLLASDSPVLLAPAMNDRMYAHPATQANLASLRQRGVAIVGPAVGALAEGPSDLPGRMSEPEVILAHVERVLGSVKSPYVGKRLVITAGPTREPLDPVRVLTNRSSGRMGYAVAAAGFARGADVRLISGPTELVSPPGVAVERIETAEELEAAVEAHLPAAHVLVMAAAPGDFRVAEPSATKRARSAGPVDVRVEPTSDILAATVGARPEGLVVVGFALETDDGPCRAERKLLDKRLDLIVLNMENDPDAGFEVETNRVTLIGADGSTPLPVMSKRGVAEKLLDVIEAKL